ncbi:hypothetical protein JCM14469_08920 [Desulfatiferula olefinivorans]
MAQFKNLMEIFKLLDKSNCRRCNQKTCMAFAAEVFTGKMKLSDCPKLPPSVIAAHASEETAFTPRDDGFFALMDELKMKIRDIDLAERADAVGGTFENGRLTVRCLGKEVHLTEDGRLITDIHINHWFAVPFYQHVINARHTGLSGNWVPYRELPGGKDGFRLFDQRCEKPLKAIADTHTELFEDLVRLFNGKKVDNHYESDISLVLHPFPTVPVLICYWKPDEGMGSDLNVFFDARVEEKLPIRSLYTLSAGLVVMFEKITRRHG